jgi:ammonium transporter, Amt family
LLSRWYGFNSGSIYEVSSIATADIAARSAVVTTLGGCAGGVAAILYTWRRSGQWDVVATCNGILCGLVSVTGGSSVFEPWAALITGSLSAVAFPHLEQLVLRIGLDDAVSASAMHGGIGVLGTLYVGLFAKGPYVLEFLGKTKEEFDGAAYKGLFYGGNGKLLACQVIGVLLVRIVRILCDSVGAIFARQVIRMLVVRIIL